MNIPLLILASSIILLSVSVCWGFKSLSRRMDRLAERQGQMEDLMALISAASSYTLYDVTKNLEVLEEEAVDDERYEDAQSLHDTISAINDLINKISEILWI